jgi:hypothetical protein
MRTVPIANFDRPTQRPGEPPAMRDRDHRGWPVEDNRLEIGVIEQWHELPGSDSSAGGEFAHPGK